VQVGFGVLDQLKLAGDELEELGEAEAVDFLVQAHEGGLHQHVQNERECVPLFGRHDRTLDEAQLAHLLLAEVDLGGVLVDLECVFDRLLVEDVADQVAHCDLALAEGVLEQDEDHVRLALEVVDFEQAQPVRLQRAQIQPRHAAQNVDAHLPDLGCEHNLLGDALLLGEVLPVAEVRVRLQTHEIEGVFVLLDLGADVVLQVQSHQFGQQFVHDWILVGLKVFGARVVRQLEARFGVDEYFVDDGQTGFDLDQEAFVQDLVHVHLHLFDQVPDAGLIGEFRVFD